MGLENLLIAVNNHLRRAAAFYAVTGDHAYETFVGIGVNKHFHVKHLSQLRIRQYKYALHQNDVSRFHRDSLGLTGAREIAVGGHLNCPALLQKLKVADKERPLYGVRFVKIDLAAQFGGHMAGVLIIGILTEHSHLTGRQRVDYLVDYRGLTTAGATGDTNYKHFAGLKVEFVYCCEFTTFFSVCSHTDVKS